MTLVNGQPPAARLGDISTLNAICTDGEISCKQLSLDFIIIDKAFIITAR